MRSRAWPRCREAGNPPKVFAERRISPGFQHGGRVRCRAGRGRRPGLLGKSRQGNHYGACGIASWVMSGEGPASYERLVNDGTACSAAASSNASLNARRTARMPPTFRHCLLPPSVQPASPLPWCHFEPRQFPVICCNSDLHCCSWSSTPFSMHSRSNRLQP